MKQKSNETSSSRWEIKFELTAPLWILINPELVRRRTQTRAAKSKRRSRFSWLEKKKEFIIREIYECFEPSRLERLVTQPRLLNQIWIPRIFTDRGIRAGRRGGLGSGIMRQVVGPGTRAQSVSGLIRVTMLRENRTVVAPRWPIFFFFFSFFFDHRHLSASSSSRFVRGFQEAFVSFYKGIRFERVVRLVGRTR